MKVRRPPACRGGRLLARRVVPRDLTILMSVGSDPIQLNDAQSLVATEIEKIQAAVRLLRATIDQVEAGSSLQASLGQVREIGRRIEDHAQAALAFIADPDRALPGID